MIWEPVHRQGVPFREVDGSRDPLADEAVAGSEMEELVSSPPWPVEYLDEVDLAVERPFSLRPQQHDGGVPHAGLGPEPDLPASVGKGYTIGYPAADVAVALIAMPDELQESASHPDRVSRPLRHGRLDIGVSVDDP